MPYTLTEAKRKKYLSLIHLQKAKAHLDDETYVTILYSYASVDSAAKITTIQQFEAVVTALNQVLITQGQAPQGDRAYVPHASTFLNAVKVRACRILAPCGNSGLQAILKKSERRGLKNAPCLNYAALWAFYQPLKGGIDNASLGTL